MTATSPVAVAALVLSDVTVAYGDTIALSDVSVSFAPGMIHAVVGQNGAGKSTFARTCAGLVRPARGSLSVLGRAMSFGNVKEARGRGIELVHQNFALPPSFTVAEALEYGSDRRGPWFYSKKSLEKRWRPHLEALGVKADLRDPIRYLPVETQQAIEIARALIGDTKILILDEPTALLSPEAVEVLFEQMRTLRDGGVTILIVLHKVREVLAIAETITVLRQGKVVAKLLARSEVEPNALAAVLMGSREESAQVPVDVGPTVAVRGSSVLDVRNLSVRSDEHGSNLANARLSIGAGEIVGIAGVEGNGQRQLVRAIAGLAKLDAGEILLEGKDVSTSSLRDRRLHGLRIVPFERDIEGVSLSSTLWENWAARGLSTAPMFANVRPLELRACADSALKKWKVRYNSVDQLAASLSGGNAQRLVLSREFDQQARLIVAAQPTRGLDIQATSFVWTALRESADRGCGVLVVSSDLDELFSISDRIVVLLSGATVAEFVAPYDLAQVGSAMTGARS